MFPRVFRRFPQAVPIALVALLLLTIPALALAAGGRGAHPPQKVTGALAAAFAAQSDRFEGRFVVRHADYFADGKATFEDRLELDDGTQLRLHFGAGRRPDLVPGSRVSLAGARRGGSLAVADGSAQVVSGATTATSTGTTTKRIAVVLFTFSDKPTQPYTPAHAAGVAFTNSNSVAAYYQAASWGRVQLTGDVFGWYAIADSSTSCNVDAWATSAKAKAAAAGVDLSTYNHIVYGFPSAGCGWSGLGDLPGRESWLNGSGGMSLRTMAHELGHNFGTHHASTMTCTEGGARVPLAASSGSCSSSEYGDPFSVMGSSTRRHTNFSLGNFTWLLPENTLVVTSGGDYLLKPLYDPAGGVQSLRLQRTSTSFLTIEFRQPTSSFDAFSSTDPAVTGATVRLAGSYASRSQSQLVDTTPSTSSFGDAPLAVGRTLVDPLTGASLTTVSAGPSGAVIRVSFAPDGSPPSQPGSLTATALDSSRVSLSWVASTDNVGVAGYRVYRNATLVATVTTTGHTDTGLSASTAYSYQVVAFDAAGNAGAAATASATTPGADSNAPSAPANLSAALGKGKKVALSWSASTDDVGVAGYRVYRDGKLVATVTGTSHTDTLGGGKNPSASYYVVAFDAAGNVSPPSATLLVKP